MKLLSVEIALHCAVYPQIAEKLLGFGSRHDPSFWCCLFMRKTLSERVENSSKSADLRLGADKASLNYGTFSFFNLLNAEIY